MKTRAIMFTVLCSMLLSSCWWNKDETPTVMVDDGRVVPVFSADNNASLTFVSPDDGSVDVSGHMPITFLWDAPVFALQDPQTTQAFLHEHITIEPETPGSWYLVGSTGIVFEPREQWKPSNEYTVTMDAKGFGEVHVVSFSTPRLAIERAHGNLIGNEPLNITFNQEVDIDVARELAFHPHIRGSFDYGTRVEWRGEKQIHTTDTSILTFTPSRPWTPSTTYTIILKSGAHGLHGNLPAQEPAKVSFETEPPFSLNNGCLSFQPDDAYDSVSVWFSAPVRVSEILEHVSVHPIDEQKWAEHVTSFLPNSDENDEVYGVYVPPMNGYWEPGIEYTLTVDPDIRDIYGRSLRDGDPKYLASGEVKIEAGPGGRRSCTFSVVFPDRISSVFFPNDVRTFQRGTDPVFSVAASGKLTGATLQLKRYLPDNQVYQVPLDLPDLTHTREILSLDMKKYFSDALSDSSLPPGWYSLMISWIENGQNRWRSTDFVIMDFPVQIKKQADTTYEIIPSAFPGSIPPDTHTSTWYGRTYTSHMGGYTFQNCPTPAACTDMYQFVAVVRDGESIGIGSTMFSEGISPWDASVNYSPGTYTIPISGVALTDRPLYKPGDTVHFASIFRKRIHGRASFPFLPAHLANQSFSISIRNSTYDEVYTHEGYARGGHLDGSWTIPEDAQLGQYSIDLQYGENTYQNVHTDFYVTEYRKPNFLMTGDFDTEHALSKETVTAHAQANYAFGGPLANKPVSYTASLFGYEKLPPWGGWHWYRQKKDKLISQGSTTLRGDGTIRIPLNLDVELDDDIIWDALSVEVTVQATDAQSSTHTFTVPFSVSSYQVDLSPTSWSYSDDEDIALEGSISDLSNDPVSTRVQATLLRKTWVRTDAKDHAGDYVGEWDIHEEAVDEVSTSSDARGDFVVSFAVPDTNGEYIVRVQAQDDKHRTAQDEHHFWVWRDASQPAQIKASTSNKIITLYPDSDVYQPGDTAQILFPHNEWEVLRAYATIERGNVLEKVPVDLESQTIDIPIKSWMAPNIYITLVIEGVDARGSPRMKWGSLSVPVHDPSRSLDIDISLDHEVYRPADTATVHIRTTVNARATQANLIVAVVDQTLLALLARDVLGLWQHFLSDMPLGVQTYHSLAHSVSQADLQDIYDKVEVIREAALEGIGGGKEGDELRPRGDFRDTAYFTAKVQTDVHGSASIDIPLPDNLTTWNIWVIGHTEDNAFGEAESSFVSTLPLRITPEIPNVLRAGDVTQLGVQVHRGSGTPEGEVTISLSVPEQYQDWLVGDTRHTKDLKDEVLASFELRVPDGLDEAHQLPLTFAVHDTHGNTDAIEVTRDIIPAQTTVSVAEFLDVREPTDLVLASHADARESQAHIRVYADMFDALEWIPDFAHARNYGCSEQTFTDYTASLIYADLTSTPISPSTQDLIKARNFIESTQVQGGGFAFWPGSNYASAWLTTNVIEFAEYWQRTGVPLDARRLIGAKRWLAKEVLSTCDTYNWRCIDDTTRAYAAYILTRDNILAHSGLDYIAEKHLSTGEAKAWWLLAITEAQDKGKTLTSTQTETIADIQKEFERQLIARDRYTYWQSGDTHFYSQDERLTSVYLSYALRTGILPSYHTDIVRYLVESRSQTLSGNTALRILASLMNYSDARGDISFPITYHVTADEQDVLSGQLRNTGDIADYTTTVGDGPLVLNFSSEQDNPYLADVVLKERFDLADRKPVSKGFWIEREIYALDDDQFAQPLDTLKAGESYVTRIRIASNTAHRQVLITDPLISGVESVDEHLDNTRKIYHLQDDVCIGWCPPLVTHRELAQSESRFFIDYLQPGIHEIIYIIQARIPGTYPHEPIKILEMYHPETFATGEGKKIVVE